MLLQPLGHHSRGLEVSHGGAPERPRQRFSRCERFFCTGIACAGPGRSRSFPLAPSASRSRLKLRRGTEAFRGNGTPAEWTNRQAFGHFFFRLRAACRPGSAVARPFTMRFPAASAFSRLRRLARSPPAALDSLSHRALSRKQPKPRRGVGSPSGPRHASEVEDATESRSVRFVFRASALRKRDRGAVRRDLAHDPCDLVAVEAHGDDRVGPLLARRLA